MKEAGAAQTRRLILSVTPFQTVIISNEIFLNHLFEAGQLRKLCPPSRQLAWLQPGNDLVQAVHHSLAQLVDFTGEVGFLPPAVGGVYLLTRRVSGGICWIWP
jgi:hypothetical protein